MKLSIGVSAQGKQEQFVIKSFLEDDVFFIILLNNIYYKICSESKNSSSRETL